jgi:hypothetical protein
MLIWNSQAHHIVQTYLQAFRDGKHITPFLVLQWPGQVGKRMMITQLLKTQLGQYRHTDAKVLRNLTEVLWKKHSFKVEVWSSDQHVVDKDTGEVYEDLWSRDLRGWLARAPLWELKVVIIEDIDRMTVSAANALLKEFEEPLPWRLIVGTVDDWKTLLDTIVSRAFLVKFHRVWESDMMTMLSDTTDPEKIQTLLRLSAWAPWRLKNFLDNPKLVDSIQRVYSEIKAYCLRWWSIVDQMMCIKQRNEQGWSNDMLLEMLIGEWLEINTDICIQGRKMLMSNVNQENVMWNVMLRIAND